MPNIRLKMSKLRDFPVLGCEIKTEPKDMEPETKFEPQESEDSYSGKNYDSSVNREAEPLLFQFPHITVDSEGIMKQIKSEPMKEDCDFMPAYPVISMTDVKEEHSDLENESDDCSEKVKRECNELECKFSPEKQDLHENEIVEPFNFEVALVKSEQEFPEDNGNSSSKDPVDLNSTTNDVTDGDSNAEVSIEIPSFRSIQTTPVIIKIGEEKSYICRECGEKFSSRLGWKSHFYATHKPYSCGECNESFSRKANLASHMHIHTGYKPYVCMECCKSFTQKAHLKHHMDIHSGSKPFSCPHCNESFLRKTYLENHMHVHTGFKPFICAECGKSFNQKKVLRKHLVTHLGNKLYYFCNQCHRKFTQKSQFEKHIKSIKGCKQFVCEICNKAFSIKGNLKAHVLNLHTPDVKTHVCTSCGKAFSRQSLLKSHMHSHDVNKRYDCPLCDKKFSWISYLKIHMSAHSSEKQCQKLFHCKICDQSYSWREYSKSHLNAH